MSIADIYNQIRVDDRIATAGQPSADQLQDARAEGFEAVINLAPLDPTKGALPDEAGLVESLGMDYFHIPVDWLAPQRDDFNRFREIMDALQGRRILIHCVANFRVTAFYSRWAMRAEGWSRQHADELVARIWDQSDRYQMSEAWRRLLAEIQFDTGTPK